MIHSYPWICKKVTMIFPVVIEVFSFSYLFSFLYIYYYYKKKKRKREEKGVNNVFSPKEKRKSLKLSKKVTAWN